MAELLLRMLAGATLGLAAALLLRRPARHVVGAGAAFALWLLPVMLALAPLLPRPLARGALVVLPTLTVTPHAAARVLASGAAFIDWRRVLWMAWLAGAALGLARLAVHYVRLCARLRGPSRGMREAVRALVPDLDPRRVRVHAAGPAVVWALPRSLVLLPEDFTERFAGARTRALVLRHELTHLRRGDAWWSLAMEAASALLWFHPLAWFARPRFRLDQELACDAASAHAAPGRAADYARALLDSVAARPASALIPWLTEPQLKERIAMLACTQPGVLRRRAGLAAVIALLAAAPLIAGGEAPVAVAPASTARPSITFAVPGTPPRALANASTRATPPTVDITYKNRNPPRYPAEAIKKGEQGNVLLDITVDAAGTVKGVQVDRHGTDASASLQAVAMQAAAMWKFNPGRRNGKAVGGVIQVPVNFSLDKDYGRAHAPKPCPVGNVYDAAASQCVKPRPGAPA